MKSFFSTVGALLVAAVSASALTFPGASTPAFYLVSSSTTPSANLLPIRMASIGVPTLTSAGDPAIFYFYQGQLVVHNPNAGPGNQTPLLLPLINSFQTANGCTNHGSLTFILGGSSNKCARYNTFGIQSNNQNSQLGAEFVFNWTGGFYSCNNGEQLYYKVDPADGPSGCVPIHLNTVAVPDA